MYKYKFANGDIITSKLDKEEMLKRMYRLDTLRVLTEGYEEGEGYNIWKKCRKAYNKKDNFSGIIRLSINEKDFLSYCLEGMVTDKEKEVIEYYTKY